PVVAERQEERPTALPFPTPGSRPHGPGKAALGTPSPLRFIEIRGAEVDACCYGFSGYGGPPSGGVGKKPASGMVPASPGGDPRRRDAPKTRPALDVGRGKAARGLAAPSRPSRRPGRRRQRPRPRHARPCPGRKGAHTLPGGHRARGGGAV